MSYLVKFLSISILLVLFTHFKGISTATEPENGMVPMSREELAKLKPDLKRALSEYYGQTVIIECIESGTQTAKVIDARYYDVYARLIVCGQKKSCKINAFIMYPQKLKVTGVNCDCQ